MGKRPARCYRHIRGPANTRVGKYVRGVPDARIILCQRKDVILDIQL